MKKIKTQIKKSATNVKLVSRQEATAKAIQHYAKNKSLMTTENSFINFKFFECELTNDGKCEPNGAGVWKSGNVLLQDVIIGVSNFAGLDNDTNQPGNNGKEVINNLREDVAGKVSVHTEHLTFTDDFTFTDTSSKLVKRYNEGQGIDGVGELGFGLRDSGGKLNLIIQSVDAGGFYVKYVPTSETHVASKGYVDDVSGKVELEYVDLKDGPFTTTTPNKFDVNLIPFDINKLIAISLYFTVTSQAGLTLQRNFTFHLLAPDLSLLTSETGQFSEYNQVVQTVSFDVDTEPDTFSFIISDLINIADGTPSAEIYTVIFIGALIGTFRK